MHCNGFFFQKELIFLKNFVHKGIYDISGFGFGAQKAYDEAFLRISRGRRVNKLILLSPAFFGNGKMNQSDKILQIKAFEENKKIYTFNLLKLMGEENNLMEKNPTSKDFVLKIKSSDLYSMFDYIWDKKKIETLSYRGVSTEIYLGGKDKTINALKISEFFAPHATIYLIKKANHFLKITQN